MPVLRGRLWSRVPGKGVPLVVLRVTLVLVPWVVQVRRVREVRREVGRVAPPWAALASPVHMPLRLRSEKPRALQRPRKNKTKKEKKKLRPLLRVFFENRTPISFSIKAGGSHREYESRFCIVFAVARQTNKKSALRGESVLGETARERERAKCGHPGAL